MPVTILSDAQKKLKPIFKKMNQEADELDIDQRQYLMITDKAVDEIMGPDPVPSLDIEMDEIKDKL